MTVKWNAKAADVKLDPVVRDALLENGWKIAREAAILAPKSAGPGGGAGAASIRAEWVIVDGEPEVRVSWDRAHFYMLFAEMGTDHQNATPFLRPAALKYQ